MQHLKTILISLGVSILGSIGIILFIYNFVPIFPINSLPIGGEQMFGTSVTNLDGGDTMSGFPTVYNANLAAMNAGKIEISSTTLPLITTLTGLDTVGTITTGVWNGTAIGVAYNGTGTTSPTLNQLMVGNTTSGFKVIPFGTNGQFLTASTTGNIPYFSTSIIDQDGNYAWTGTHSWSNETTFTGTSTFGNILSDTDLVALTASTSITGWTLPQPVYIASSTGINAGGVLLVDGNDLDTLGFSGFAVTTAASGETVYVQTNGIVDGFTGLTKGAKYFVQDAAGTIGTTVGTYEVGVGIAISVTELLIQKYDWEYSGVITSDGGSLSRTGTTTPEARFVLVDVAGTGSSGITKCTMTLTRYGLTSDGCESEDGGTEGGYAVTWNTTTNVITITRVGSVGMTSVLIYQYR